MECHVLHNPLTIHVEAGGQTGDGFGELFLEVNGRFLCSRVYAPWWGDEEFKLALVDLMDEARRRC